MKCLKLHRPQDEVPEEEAEESAHEEEGSGEPRVGLIEAQREGEKVDNKGEPTDKGQPAPERGHHQAKPGVGDYCIIEAMSLLHCTDFF